MFEKKEIVDPKIDFQLIVIITKHYVPKNLNKACLLLFVQHLHQIKDRTTRFK